MNYDVIMKVTVRQMDVIYLWLFHTKEFGTCSPGQCLPVTQREVAARSLLFTVLIPRTSSAVYFGTF